MPYISRHFLKTVSYLTVSTDDFINTTNNGTAFLELKKLSEEAFKIQIQKGLFLNIQMFGSLNILLGLVLIKPITSGIVKWGVLIWKVYKGWMYIF